MLRRTSRENKMDWVVKILLDQGGDLDFIWEEIGGEKEETEGESQGKGKGKKERAKDGLAMIHRAADSGNGEFESDII